MHLTSYLNYGGNCREAFEFYAAHLGGRITQLSTFADAPPGVPRHPTLRDDQVMHARLEIAGTVLLGSDAPPEVFQPMRSAYLALTLDSIADAERVYALLVEGGQPFMPMQETFFAHRFAMLRDRFGTSWMLMHERAGNA